MEAVVQLLFLIVPVALALAGIFGVPRLIQGRRVVGLFKSGTGHRWRDEISGQYNGRPFNAFEFRYATGAGRFRDVRIEAMIHQRLAGVSLPHFALVPANSYLFRIGRTPQDIDFPEDKTFSKAYVLTGQDQTAIRALYTPALRAALTAAPGQHVAAGGQDLFWWQQRGLPPPDQFDSFLDEGSRVLRLFAK
jgi:hypothetical protein